MSKFCKAWGSQPKAIKHDKWEDALCNHTLEDTLTHVVQDPPEGPRTLKGALTFAPMIRKMQKNHKQMFDRLIKKLDACPLGSTPYSGVDTPVLALHQAMADTRRCGAKFKCDSGVVWMEACDNDGDAQKILLQFDDDVGAACVFENMNHRVPSKLLEELEKVKLPDKIAPAEEHKNATAAMRALIDVNADVLFPDNLWCKCVKHNKYCLVYHVLRLNRRIRRSITRHWKTRPLTLRVAGTTCTAFSNYGKKEKMSHKSSIPFLIWEAEVKKRRPCVWVQENGPEFPAEMLVEHLGELYVIHTILLCPTMIGFATRRLRRWTFGVLWKVLVFVGNMPEFLNLVCCTLQMDGQAYSIEDRHRVQAYIAEQAEGQGIFFNSADKSLLQWKEGMDPASVPFHTSVIVQILFITTCSLNS